MAGSAAYCQVKTTSSAVKSLPSDHALQQIDFAELNDHTPPHDVAALLAPALAGEDLALISDAGCPGIADPGAPLVAAAHRAGIRRILLPSRNEADVDEIPADVRRMEMTDKERYERIREELRNGKTPPSAVDQGFGHAWITIVDTHVTTIVSAAKSPIDSIRARWLTWFSSERCFLFSLSASASAVLFWARESRAT